MGKKIKVSFPKFHDLQMEIYKDPHPIKNYACGTKTGKTFGEQLMFNYDGQDHRRPKQLFFWIAPDYDRALMALDSIFLGQIWPAQEVMKQFISVNRKPPPSLTFKTTGTRISYRSGNDPDSVKGQAVHWAKLDEVAMMKEIIMHNVMTTLTRTKGRYSAFSTPKGKNWWYYEWLKGWDGDEYYSAYTLRHKYSKYKSWRAPTTANPHIDAEWVKTMKQTLPEHIYMQEYLAVWLEEGGDVFRNTNEVCILDYVDEPVRDRQYIIAWDIAKVGSENMYTVFDASVFPYEQRFVGVFDKFTPWEFQWEFIANLAGKWNRAKVWYDNTGGSSKDVHYEQLSRKGVDCYRFDFSARNMLKLDMVHQLILFMEKKDIRLLKDTRYKNQMDSYTYDTTIAGGIRYRTPEGIPDDFIDCCMMGLYACLSVNPRKISLVGSQKKFYVRKTPLQHFWEQEKKKMDRLWYQNRDYLIRMAVMSKQEDPEAYVKAMKRRQDLEYEERIKSAEGVI